MNVLKLNRCAARNLRNFMTEVHRLQKLVHLQLDRVCFQAAQKAFIRSTSFLPVVSKSCLIKFDFYRPEMWAKDELIYVCSQKR